MIATILGVYSVLALIISICGHANDHNNVYPLPLLISGAVAFGIAEMLPALSG